MAQAKPTTPASGTYLIVIGDYIVALDLAQTVADFCPTAQVIQQSTAVAALAAVAAIDRVTVAFVGEPPHSFARSELARLIADKGGRVVFVGGEAEDLGPGSAHTVLNRPFSTPAVLAHLKQATPTANPCDEFARSVGMGRLTRPAHNARPRSSAMSKPKLNP